MSRFCRSCGSDELSFILSLGRTPLANALLAVDPPAEPEKRYPLDVAVCRRCALVQILETVPPEDLFTNYLYFSSFSDSLLEHARQLATRLIAERRLGADSLVVEIASNDGYLLRNYLAAGVPILGIEPAANIAAVARAEHGIPTLCEFFGEQLANRLAAEGQRADIVHAHNVLAHVADLNGFVEGLRLLLKPSGVAVIEVPYVKEMLDRCEFDTIYHEHLCYFSLTALDLLFQRHGLLIQDVEQLAIHGGTLRLFAGPTATASQRSTAVTNLLAEEQAWGVSDPVYYESFGRRVEALKTALVDLLVGLRRQGARVAAYGASAKGSTLLNYCGIGRDLLEFAVDRSTYKQGMYMPGVHLPIYAPERVLEEQPDYLLLLSWNFAEEILEQQAEYRRRGGKFIIPVPEPKIV